MNVLWTNWSVLFSIPWSLGKFFCSLFVLWLASRKMPYFISQKLSSIRAVTGLLFSLFGILQIAPLSIGNDPVSKSAFRKIGAALVALFFGLWVQQTSSIRWNHTHPIAAYPQKIMFLQFPVLDIFNSRWRWLQRSRWSTQCYEDRTRERLFV